MPLLPDFVQHELSMFGTTMYVPTDYLEMIDLMSRGIITTRGMISHRFSLEEISAVLDMIDKRKEKTFIEEECDKLYLITMRNITKNSTDVLTTISWYKIFERFEACADACEHVSECVG